MAIQCDWLVKRQVAHITFRGAVTTREIDDYEEAGIQMLEMSEIPRLHTLLDFTNADGLPPLTYMSKLKINKHPNVGWAIFYGVTNPLIKFVLSAVVQFGKVRTRFVSTREEAVALLHELDPNIPKFEFALEPFASIEYAESE